MALDLVGAELALVGTIRVPAPRVITVRGRRDALDDHAASVTAAEQVATHLAVAAPEGLNAIGRSGGYGAGGFAEQRQPGGGIRSGW